MSSTTPTRKQLNQVINVCCGAHDLVCDCDEPTKHILLHIFSTGEPYHVTKKQKIDIEKCLITIEENGIDTADDIGITDGDLERLFAEDDAGENDNR